MRVLVTGATGFTGGHLARTLRSRGYQVRAFVRNPDAAKSLVEDGIEVWQGDLLDSESVQRAAEGCEAIYHIAAVYREARHTHDFYEKVNVEGTRHVLDAAERWNVKRLVHCSTVGVHGEVKRIPADETSPFAPDDVYQATKLQGELLARERIDGGLPGVIFRPLGIYGPGDMRFLKLFKAIERGTFRMIGAGDVFYHMTYVSDLVDGIILCGEHPGAVGETYILGGPGYTTLTELTEMVARALGARVRRPHIPVAPVMFAAIVCERLCQTIGVEPPLYPRRLDFFLKNRAFSIAKAQRELGYQPKVALGEGISRVARWYRDHGLL